MMNYKPSEIKEICEMNGKSCFGCEFFNGYFCDVVGEDGQPPCDWDIDEFLDYDLFGGDDE